MNFIWWISWKQYQVEFLQVWTHNGWFEAVWDNATGQGSLKEYWLTKGCQGAGECLKEVALEPGTVVLKCQKQNWLDWSECHHQDYQKQQTNSFLIKLKLSQSGHLCPSLWLQKLVNLKFVKPLRCSSFRQSWIFCGQSTRLTFTPEARWALASLQDLVVTILSFYSVIPSHGHASPQNKCSML